MTYAAGRAERPLVRLAAFSALGIYGLLRWKTLLASAPGWRLTGLLAVALAVAAAGVALRGRGRLLLAIVVMLALLSIFPLAGAPLTWASHVRVETTANAIGHGLSALPRVFIPYAGVNEWVAMVIVLGAAVLLMSAGLLLAFAPRASSELWRAAAALPLIVLAVVPSVLLHPDLPYLQGLLLLLLVAAFMWAERLGRRDLRAVLAVGAAACAAAMLLAPRLQPRAAWVDYQGLAGSFAPSNVETFDWSQRYGPIDWPRTGRAVLEVRTAHPDYWKAEDLDVFDGRGWTQGLVPGSDSAPRPSAAAFPQWRQTLQVTIGDMSTTDVIAAGAASRPLHVSQPVVPGYSPGTWTAGADLGPGDSYLVDAYVPHPTAAQLTDAGGDSGDMRLAGYRSITLPPSSSATSQPEIIFPPFHSDAPVEAVIGLPGAGGAAVVNASPYARAFALARRLAAPAPTPYAYVLSVERYLSKGFAYSEDPPLRPYPLESFLFMDRAGYCQQFSGAMALLLRMGGVPARVASGFTSGTYNPTTRRWVATDLDAHAWVEAWFPRYGWVGFDPTPAAAPARGGRSLPPTLSKVSGAPPPATDVRRPERAAAAARKRGKIRPGSSPQALPVPLLALGGLALVFALALALATARRASRPPGDRLLPDLERAFARSGRGIADGMTLAQLEHRFRDSEEAAAYVRAIRLRRFAAAGELPTAHQRRALRAQLRAGLGVVGAARALWALPPRATLTRTSGPRRSRA